MGWFADNQWYVAAFADEIGEGVLGRTICSKPMVLYRTSSGSMTALSGMCTHRGFPLSEAPSQLVDGKIVCGPGRQGAAPAAARDHPRSLLRRHE